MPPLPDPDFSRFGHGISLLGGWLPVTAEILAVVALVIAIGWRTRRWRFVWVPVAAAVGVAVALGARAYMNSEGLASDPAPLRLWLWTSIFAASIAVAVLGFRGTPWWRRGLSFLAIPLTLLCALLVLNNWVGYYPTVQRSWGDLTSGPLPDQTDMASLAGLRGARLASARVRLSPARVVHRQRATAPAGGDDDLGRVQQPDQLDPHG